MMWHTKCDSMVFIGTSKHQFVVWMLSRNVNLRLFPRGVEVGRPVVHGHICKGEGWGDITVETEHLYLIFSQAFQVEGCHQPEYVYVILNQQGRLANVFTCKCSAHEERHA